MPDNQIFSDTAGRNVHTAAGADRCTARGPLLNEHSGRGIDCCAGHGTTGKNAYVTTGYHRAGRGAAHNVHTAAGHRCAARDTAAGNVHIAFRYRRAGRGAALNAHTATFDRRAARSAAVGNVHSAVVLNRGTVRGTAGRNVHITTIAYSNSIRSVPGRKSEGLAQKYQICVHLIGEDRFPPCKGVNAACFKDLLRSTCSKGARRDKRRIKCRPVITEFQGDFVRGDPLDFDTVAVVRIREGLCIPFIKSTGGKVQNHLSVRLLSNSIIAPVSAKGENILSAAAVHGVIPRTAGNNIISHAPHNAVIAAVSKNSIVPGAAPERIIAVAAKNGHGPTGGNKTLTCHIHNIVPGSGTDLFDVDHTGFLRTAGRHVRIDVIGKKSIPIGIIGQNKDIGICGTFKKIAYPVFPRKGNALSSPLPEFAGPQMLSRIALPPKPGRRGKKEVQNTVRHRKELFRSRNDPVHKNFLSERFRRTPHIIAVLHPDLTGALHIKNIHAGGCGFDHKAVRKIIRRDLNGTLVRRSSTVPENGEIAARHNRTVHLRITVVGKGVLKKGMRGVDPTRQCSGNRNRKSRRRHAACHINRRMRRLVRRSRSSAENSVAHRNIFKHPPGVALTHQIRLISRRNRGRIAGEIAVRNDFAPPAKAVGTVHRFGPVVNGIKQKMVIAICRSGNRFKNRTQILFRSRKYRGVCRKTHIRIFTAIVVNSRIIAVRIENIHFLRLHAADIDNDIIHLLDVMVIVWVVGFRSITATEKHHIILRPVTTFRTPGRIAQNMIQRQRTFAQSFRIFTIFSHLPNPLFFCSTYTTAGSISPPP